MDNKNHKDTWNNFSKFVPWGTVTVILDLVFMANVSVNNEIIDNMNEW